MGQCSMAGSTSPTRFAHSNAAFVLPASACGLEEMPVARKRLVYANTVVQRDSPWIPQPEPT